MTVEISCSSSRPQHGWLSIYTPEVAVPGVGRASRQMIDTGREFVSRPKLPLTLSYDRRVIDGAAGGRFMQRLRGRIGEPANLSR